MVITAGIGFGTTLLELMATSIGFGVVIFGFATSCAGMVLGRTRKELEAGALRRVFWGGVAGMCCLCLDLIVRYLG
jgi:hypothetical protein